MQQRRKLLRKVWDKLIPPEMVQREELAEAIRNGEVDTLTGIANLRGFNRRLVEEKARIERAGVENQKQGKIAYSTDSVIIYFDANELKKINDKKRGGHAEGNRYLQQIALALSEIARPSDTVARIGGDEFALILPTANLESTRKLWEKRIKPELIKRGLSLSAGSAPFDHDDIDGSKERADAAMYQAKAISRIYKTNEYIEHREIIQ